MPTSTDPTLRHTPVQPLWEEKLCATADCPGTLVFAGESFTTFKRSYKHQCDKCHRFEWLDQSYPRIQYEASR